MYFLGSVQFSHSSCLTLCNPMNCSTLWPPYLSPTPSPRDLLNPGIEPTSPGAPAGEDRSLLKLMSIESVMPSNHLILCHPLSSCPQSFPASGFFQMSQFFASGDQGTGVSPSTSDFPMNTWDWSPLGWTSWISLQSKGLSRVFSNTTVQKHQFFGAQPSSQSNSHIHIWPQEKP